MASTILVTGSTGTVGKGVVEHLASAGARVRAAVQATSKTDAITRVGAEPVVMNFNDGDSIRAALDGVEKAFLLTPVVQNHVEVSSTFIQAARAAGLNYLVKLSVIGAGAGSHYLLGREHGQTEKEIEASGIPFTFLRANFFMQNFLGLDSIKAQGAFFDSSADAKASHIDARDISSTAAALLTEGGHENKAFELTGPEALSNFEIAEILSSVTGKTINFVPVSDDEVRKAMQAGGLPDWMIESLVELYQLKRANETSAVSPAVKQITGKPAITFAQFAKDHVDAFK
jgi:uncharacterized protein YbjT (DUF2867 family)